jgi:carbohydrate kinase (thermoresistant glucokinase family)
MAHSAAPSEQSPRPARIVIVMGVSSSGKSAVGQALSRTLGAPFLDGDQFHPPANKEKMRSGVPLTDDDRWPWLEILAVALSEAADDKGVAVGACSALKRSYRDFIIEKAGEPVLFLHLDGTREVLMARIAARRHEFMPASLLDSQLATLERPAPDENAIVLSITDPVEAIATKAAQVLGRARTDERGKSG